MTVEGNIINDKDNFNIGIDDNDDDDNNSDTKRQKIDELPSKNKNKML